MRIRESVRLYFFFKLILAMSFLSFDFLGESGSNFSLLFIFEGIARLVLEENMIFLNIFSANQSRKSHNHDRC